MGEPDRETLRRQLLAWYRSTKRDFPFRRTRDPYAILVAEIILQRTRMAAGLPYYERLLAAFPTVRDLAAASEADVLRAWEGLGFYARARNLHRAAQVIVARHAGRVPSEHESLRALPGIGDYTAGAVGSIAFGTRAPAVDGNVTRVLSRVFRVEGDVLRGAGKRQVRALAADLVPADAPGEWNQALMELGATVCMPKTPHCPACPISGECLALASGVQDALPQTAAKRAVPVVRVAFVVARRGDSVLLVRRERGLHAGMYGLPGGELSAGDTEEGAVRRHLASLGVRPKVLRPLTTVRHTFSHRRWVGRAFACRAEGTPREGTWIPVGHLGDLPLVPLHRQLLARAMS